MKKEYDVFNPDPNAKVMCGDCGWIFKRRELEWVQGGGAGGGVSLCCECLKLRDSSNKKGQERYAYPDPPKEKSEEEK